MSAPANLSQLRGPILRAVSRSFYLSIRLLPAKLRDPVALAYLLARATDTLADTAVIDAAVRLEQLTRLAKLIQAEAANDDGSFEDFAERQGDPAEQALMRAVPQCLAWLRAISPNEREEIRRVLLRINEGQMLDVQRFARGTEVAALETAADLEHYTFLVAGAVGEFWSNICFLHLPNFSSRSREEMIRRGTEYGKGLQLINILRDLPGDLRAGRCYLPAGQLHLLGIAPRDLLAEPARALPLVEQWRERAQQGIAAGVEYSCAIHSWRVRLATVLPALIGARTLALLRAAGSDVFGAKVKVPRAEVRRLLLKMATSLASPRAIRTIFASLSS